jgi:sugar/nucleoside kinase (ribokinase family)
MTKPTRFDVLAMGHAIVDVIAHAKDSFITAQGMAKGSMQLIDTERAQDLYAAMEPTIQVSGGSAANTAVGVASLGGKAAFIGCVGDDELGIVFSHDLTASGVHSILAIAPEAATARCLILVTPDAERTMNTFLGAAALLGERPLHEGLIKDAAILYLEGYLFSSPANKMAYRKAASLAKAAGRKVALSLSDRFCVEGHRAEFKALIAEYVDILFANEPEITALYETHDFEMAAAEAGKHVAIACLTKGAAGSVIVADGQTIRIPAASVPRVVDTTGAGDLYAAGFLYGHTQGMMLEQSGRIAAIAAGEIIGHVGPRPETKLSTLIDGQVLKQAAMVS